MNARHWQSERVECVCHEDSKRNRKRVIHVHGRRPFDGSGSGFRQSTFGSLRSVARTLERQDGQKKNRYSPTAANGHAMAHMRRTSNERTTREHCAQHTNVGLERRLTGSGCGLGGS